MSDLRQSVIKLAHEHPELRRHLVPILMKTAMEFDTQEALDKYLKDHPGADRSNHTVKKQEGGGGSDGGTKETWAKVKSTVSEIDAFIVKKHPEVVRAINSLGDEDQPRGLQQESDKFDAAEREYSELEGMEDKEIHDPQSHVKKLQAVHKKLEDAASQVLTWVRRTKQPNFPHM